MEIMKAFARAAAKREGSSGNDFLEWILCERPDLKDKIDAGELTAYFPRQGMAGHTVIIGDEVFKGPARKELIKKFDEEPYLLKRLEQSDLPVPRVTCTGKDTVFFGMTRLPGVPLGYNVETRLTHEEQRLLAKDIVNFIVGLAHSLPSHGKLFAMHWDLKGENILIDQETKRLTGIVDFGNIKYDVKEHLTQGFWVPATLGTMPLNFLKMLEEEYNHRKDEIPDMTAAIPAPNVRPQPKAGPSA